MLCTGLAFAFAYALAGVLHELVHVLVASSLGCLPSWNQQNVTCILVKRCVHIPYAGQGWREPAVRHAGWIFSVVFAVCTLLVPCNTSSIVATSLTAFEALWSDLLRMNYKESDTSSAGWFFCGNFGMILLNSAWNATSKAKDILETMVQVTMMRGSQTGGVVTYVKASRRPGELRGVRVRVVNSKRSDLSKLVKAKLISRERRASWWNGLADGVRFYAGHTRFATTSKATLDGCHPHQWSPPQALDVYLGFADGKLKKSVGHNVEVFITHNGDLDFFSVGGQVFDLSSVQEWLVRATGSPMPCAVDSCAIAGIMDLLRTQGCWFQSVRYAYLFHVPHAGLDYEMPTKDTFRKVAGLFDEVFGTFLKQDASLGHLLASRSGMAEEVIRRQQLSSLLDLDDGDQHNFAEQVIAAFFNNDLFWAARLFLSQAKGSFGLCVTSSLDSNRQIVVGARGQTMSVAFYPRTGLVLYGSEQAAVKAGIGTAPAKATGRTVAAELSSVSTQCPEPAVRLDLDDLGGELCLLDWGNGPASVSQPNQQLTTHSMMDGKLSVTPVMLSHGMKTKFSQRLVALEDNPLVVPLPQGVKDPISQDIADIPKVLSNIQTDWNSSNSLNRLAAWNLGCQLKKRIRKKMDGELPMDAVDILVTGCEVSLWMGEQFAADLDLAFSKMLVVKSVSANKVLGLLGQEFPMPQLGHQFNHKRLNLSDSIVLLVSHSGGTFATLNVSKLLQAKTHNMFVLTSEWDTQIGRQLRSLSMGLFESRVFTTGIGVRPAEPCTISVAATHQLLTLILEHIVACVLAKPDLRKAVGSAITERDLSELERCNVDCIAALEEIVGFDRQGLPHSSATERELRAKGARWSLHVLENPYAWILCFIYVFCTVTAGYPLVTGVAIALGLDMVSDYPYVTRAFDALIYIFLPQICTLLIRIIQKRPLLHRMVGRTVVIGDSPWVAQSVEAFLSKIFACSYSATGINVHSGNPTDHLVHRMTHRVVRGSLLACGRPDGRLNALTSMESAVCLSVNQASSIQSIGATCESLTVGHNPYALPLAAHTVVLKGNRPQYLSEKVMEEKHRKKRRSSNSQVLLGEFSNLQIDKAPRDIKEKLGQLVREKQSRCTERNKIRQCFDKADSDGSGSICFEELKAAFHELGGTLRDQELQRVFEELDTDKSGSLDFEQFVKLWSMDVSDVFKATGVSSGEKDGAPEWAASQESYFGEYLRAAAPAGTSDLKLMETQSLSMELYETRIASLQRAVAFFVLFHEMGKRVADFWPRVSGGLLGYRMDRTHSIMRIATTASPVSGAEVHDRMYALSVEKEWQKFTHLINIRSAAWQLRNKSIQLLEDMVDPSFFMGSGDSGGELSPVSPRDWMRTKRRNSRNGTGLEKQSTADSVNISQGPWSDNSGSGISTQPPTEDLFEL